MTEQEWKNETNIGQLAKKVLSQRKAALIAMQFARETNPLMQYCLDFYKGVEAFLDGEITNKQFDALTCHDATVATLIEQDCSLISYHLVRLVPSTKVPIFSKIVKEMVNPFCDNSLLFSRDIIDLAQEVYNTNDEKTRLVLSDALEDDYPEEIYLHLKSGLHPKGCWLIDQILEKS